MDVVVYYRAQDVESDALRRHLADMGVEFSGRELDVDPRARREWEEIDGEVTPVVVVDHADVVHGLDVARVDQILGMVGC